MADSQDRCQWVSLQDALREFAWAKHGVQSQRHIKPLHWYIACRLCLEGGFDPDDITPRPPFKVIYRGKGKSARRIIEHDPESGGSGEQTILGGLKTKQVDVVVTKPNIGPVIAVSVKGTLNAFRNLTNRLEEAGGDCTNLHLTYRSLVYAFWSVMRANRPGRLPAGAPAGMKTEDGKVAVNDMAVDAKSKPAMSVVRYHLALSGLAGRDGIRNDVSKYEAVALTLVEVDEKKIGQVFAAYPEGASPLRFEVLFPRIYQQYDLRFVYQAPDLESVTGRKGWSDDSPALKGWSIKEYEPRSQDSSDNPE